MKKNMSRGLFALLVFMLVFALAACGMETSDPDSVQGDQGAEQETPSEQDQAEEQQKPEEEAKPESKELTIYYVDQNLMELVEESRTIEFTTEEEELRSIWKALQTPENSEHVALWKDVELLTATLQDGTLTLDITGTDKVNVGAGGEAFAIQTLINTYSQVEGVESIQLLVDGKVVETLYGHVSIDQPFKKNEQVIQ